jgi:hypothetical protein
MHAMSDGNDHQSAADAQNATMGFVTDYMHQAETSLAAGDNNSAMFLFGIAMHPVMDYSSPAHTDPQGNPIPWCGMWGGCSNTRQHGGDSDIWVIHNNHWSIEDVASLNKHPEVQTFENLAMRNWFEALTGRHCDCQ